MKKWLKWLIGIGIIILVIIVAIIVYFNVSFIGKKEAKKIVFEHAGIKENDVKRFSIELNHDDGLWQYEIEYIYDNEEYNYEIDAKTGEIIIHKIER